MELTKALADTLARSRQIEALQREATARRTDNSLSEQLALTPERLKSLFADTNPPKPSGTS